MPPRAPVALVAVGPPQRGDCLPPCCSWEAVARFLTRALPLLSRPQVTTRNEVDEDAWDSDGAHTHTSVVTGSTVRVCLLPAAGWATGWGAPVGLGC